MATSESGDEGSPSSGDELRLTELLPSGECRGRDARGREFLVRGAVPGDVVIPIGKAQRSQRRRSFALLQEAPERRDSPCSVQLECGGCALMPLASEAQLKAKHSMLCAALGALHTGLPAIRFEDSPLALGYRNRIRLRIASGRVGFFNQQKGLGCLVLEPGLRAIVARLSELGERAPLLFSAFTRCEARSADSDGRPGLLLSGEGDLDVARSAASALSASLPGFLLGVSGDPAILWQRRALTRDVSGWVPLDAFLQINDGVNQRLIEWVLAAALRSSARSALDLYAGAGNFALPLAHAGLRVSAVERHAASVRALAAAARAQGLACEGLAASAAAAVASLSAAGRRFDCVIVDAPRAGAEFDLGRLVELGARVVILCSCYAPSFARDLERLRRAGYAVEELVAFDMFPQTHHLESAALLVRGSAQG